ncbi:unnamed protein product [Coffea canephora]|uniref:Uncharacterized protein n=1 Tax=Coffea canephora TaxID=49390 RepID=A0A068V020_COFCA|nr:unnamed protein product [Coffea canephora]
MGFEDSFACEDGKVDWTGQSSLSELGTKSNQPNFFPQGKKGKEKKKITILAWETFQSLDFVCG